MRPWFILVFALALVGCAQDGIDERQDLPELDESFFRCQVQPVIASSCAFMDCHGNAERPLSLYAEQRFRLGISWDDYETPLTPEELAANFTTVRGFVARDGVPNLLSEKPLDTRAGGLYHQGEDTYGSDDVFLTTEDPRYQVLREFSSGARDSSDCIPREDLHL
jgi:hypothetical protein